MSLKSLQTFASTVPGVVGVVPGKLGAQHQHGPGPVLLAAPALVPGADEHKQGAVEGIRHAVVGSVHLQQECAFLDPDIKTTSILARALNEGCRRLREVLGAFSVIVKLRAIFGNLGFKL